MGNVYALEHFYQCQLFFNKILVKVAKKLFWLANLKKRISAPVLSTLTSIKLKLLFNK